MKKHVIYTLLATSAYLTSCGTDQDNSSLASQTDPIAEVAAPLLNAEAVPTNGGFNPDAFAYDLNGRVLLGSNPCVASGVTAELQTRSKGKVIEVFAVKKIPTSKEPIYCTMQYQPVYAQVQLVVRGMHSTTKAVRVLHVDQLNHSVDINELKPRQ